jgi:hypothetical protein
MCKNQADFHFTYREMRMTSCSLLRDVTSNRQFSDMPSLSCTMSGCISMEVYNVEMVNSVCKTVSSKSG